MSKPQVGYIARGNPPARDNVGVIGTQKNDYHAGSGSRHVVGNYYDVGPGANFGTISGGGNFGEVHGGKNCFGIECHYHSYISNVRKTKGNNIFSELASKTSILI